MISFTTEDKQEVWLTSFAQQTTVRTYSEVIMRWQGLTGFMAFQTDIQTSI